MKETGIIICCLVLLVSCHSKKDKPAPKIIQKEKIEQSVSDKQLQEWLQAKVWIAENDMAPIALMKLNADGMCEFRSGNKPSRWEIRGGKLGLSRLTEWPIEKLTDSSFRLYVKPTDKWYVYRQSDVGN